MSLKINFLVAWLYGFFLLDYCGRQKLTGGVVGDKTIGDALRDLIRFSQLKNREGFSLQLLHLF